jgi:hypothetical protein
VRLSPGRAAHPSNRDEVDVVLCIRHMYLASSILEPTSAKLQTSVKKRSERLSLALKSYHNCFGISLFNKTLQPNHPCCSLPMLYCLDDCKSRQVTSMNRCCVLSGHEKKHIHVADIMQPTLDSLLLAMASMEPLPEWGFHHFHAGGQSVGSIPGICKMQSNQK